MRQKLAKAIRRTAREYARRQDQLNNLFVEVSRGTKFVRFDPISPPVEVPIKQILLQSGPRFLHQQLKRAVRSGTLAPHPKKGWRISLPAEEDSDVR